MERDQPDQLRVRVCAFISKSDDDAGTRGRELAKRKWKDETRGDQGNK